jgi:hypothetical protein
VRSESCEAKGNSTNLASQGMALNYLSSLDMAAKSSHPRRTQNQIFSTG